MELEIAPTFLSLKLNKVNAATKAPYEWMSEISSHQEMSQPTETNKARFCNYGGTLILLSKTAEVRHELN